MLSSFETTANSTLSAIATAAEAGVKGAGDGFTAAKEIRTTWTSLQNQAANDKIEDLKRKVESREYELKQAGQEATATDYAELERLKQQRAIAEAEASLSPAGLATAALKRDTELDIAQREANQTVRDLRAELSLLQLHNEIAEQRKKAPAD